MTQAKLIWGRTRLTQLLLVTIVLVSLLILFQVRTSFAATREASASKSGNPLLSSHSNPSSKPTPYSYPPDPCLGIDFSAFGYYYANSGVFYLKLKNSCSFPVKNIAISWALEQIACSKGTGNASGTISGPSYIGEGVTASNTLGWYSYCIQCRNGTIVGYPAFSIYVNITGARGFDAVGVK